uniref:Uncharacterized protein n=1 Tax=Acrobeloides nanus TaxID=290746 RepID=A0A914C5D1_9BILA
LSTPAIASKTSTESVKSTLKNSIFNAPPELLQDVARVFTELASRKAESEPDIEGILTRLISTSDFSKESSISKENDSKEHSLSPEFYGADSKKAEAAKRQLSSGRAKLEKQRTLERVRCFTTATEESKVAAEKIPESNGMEKEICMIVEVVLPWVKGHETEAVQEELIKE